MLCSLDRLLSQNNRSAALVQRYVSLQDFEAALVTPANERRERRDSTVSLDRESFFRIHACHSGIQRLIDKEAEGSGALSKSLVLFTADVGTVEPLYDGCTEEHRGWTAQTPGARHTRPGDVRGSRRAAGGCEPLVVIDGIHPDMHYC